MTTRLKFRCSKAPFDYLLVAAPNAVVSPINPKRSATE